ncbi:hypothetical protein IV203_015461 [Nitzschia inconspicua]|uniref:Uncharacterized protein n=1 Tax=Nitzschia inconspicua TaxID=303405 RepID=A0A9K3PTA1_9STRA|nr:hypothetical protein IV203_020304 [Nitzschia inconspicua]KAG7358872.1 hypothetical protein IV203_015461 [Nitzschia inconspicua]
MPTVSEGGLLGVVSRQKLCMSHTRATLRIGQVSKSKMGFGTGLSVDAMVNATTDCSATTVFAEYDFGGGLTKRKCLNIRSLHAVLPVEGNQ